MLQRQLLCRLEKKNSSHFGLSIFSRFHGECVFECMHLYDYNIVVAMKTLALFVCVHVCAWCVYLRVHVHGHQQLNTPNQCAISRATLLSLSMPKCVRVCVGIW